MNSTVQRTPKSTRQSLFFQDLATPVSSRKSSGKFTTPGQAAAVSALWRENFSNSDLPPPPMFTLEDRSDFSPESGIQDYPMSSEGKSDPRTPVQGASKDFWTPKSNKSEASTAYAVMGKRDQHQSQHNPVASSSWWSPAKSGGSAEPDDKGKGSPVEGVVQPGALITLPPPREVARPEIKKNSIPVGNLDEEEWVTVYGFSPAETNLVLREFEKCGIILKHIPGPRNANWMHILYQNRADAHKALSKNGMQINGVLIIGVKPVDPMQRQGLNERLNNHGFVPLPLAPSSKTPDSIPFRTSSQPHYLQNGSSSGRQSAGTVAAPAKSVVSKVMDLMFGV
ncbi:nuclear pore complex protein NUP35 [Ipomoea triloba]|uniref:nuclear pore complex protein NUP35 n=1 Tax=Ipomoea triloba TaxID=35885 RepID=UPI00125D653E|nr:nuclear pore complex protein NUP35 [Ipomoea triloba]